jgi:hypothetical protein
MSKLEDKLVDDTIDAHDSTDKLELRISGVIEDEVIAVKAREMAAPDSAHQL